MDPMRAKFAGIITSMVTPFDQNGRVNTSLLAKLIEEQIAAGINGVMVTGGTGEYVNLDESERIEIIRVAFQTSAGRIPIIAGILEPSTRGALRAIRVAEEAGADAFLVLTPFYLSPSALGLVRHFELLARAVTKPIILYNNPARTGINLDATVLRSIGALESVIGIKECDRDVGRVTSKIDAVGEQINFLAGDDDLLYPMLVLGARGGVTASSMLAPHWAVNLIRAFSGGDLEQSRRLHSQIVELLTCFYLPNHPGPLKEALSLQGWQVGPARPPLMMLEPEKLKELRAHLGRLGILDSTPATELVRMETGPP